MPDCVSCGDPGASMEIQTVPDEETDPANVKDGFTVKHIHRDCLQRIHQEQSAETKARYGLRPGDEDE